MVVKRPRIRIKQTARVVNNTSGPIKIDGVTAYDSEGNAVAQVGIEVDGHENDE